MIAIFGDFLPIFGDFLPFFGDFLANFRRFVANFRRKNWRFLKNQCYDQIFSKTCIVLSKNAHFSAKIF
jgi:hypothetical protein